jgi:hypothetical protein
MPLEQTVMRRRPSSLSHDAASSRPCGTHARALIVALACISRARRVGSTIRETCVRVQCAVLGGCVCGQIHQRMLCAQLITKKVSFRLQSYACMCVVRVC